MSTPSSIILFSALFLTASACCQPAGEPPCCTQPGTYLYDPRSYPGAGAPTLLDQFHDAGIPADVIFRGDACIPLCLWAAQTCFYGPSTCADQIQEDNGVLSADCQIRGDGSVERNRPDPILVRCTPRPCGVAGRRSYSPSPSHHSNSLCDHLSSLAALEHESITAFTEMASFLALHGAPASLRARLTVAAEDEARHTHAMISLALHAANTHVVLHDTPASHPPSLFEFALHNAREGCVRETYGASLAHYQAQHATDPLVRDTFATIAIEESQHAQLSWDVAHWVDTLLTEPERALVASAITEATNDLAASLAQPSPREWRDTLGLPSADVALAMHQQLRRALWTAHAPS